MGHAKQRTEDPEMARLIQEIMTPNVQIMRPDDTVQLAAKVMRDRDIGMVPVSDGKRIVGTVTDRDIALRAVAEGRDPKQATLSEIMSKGDPAWCYEDDSVEEASGVMSRRQVRRLLVLDHHQHLVGVVSLGDVALESDEFVAGR